jgi:hypothetical protein
MKQRTLNFVSHRDRGGVLCQGGLEWNFGFFVLYFVWVGKQDGNSFQYTRRKPVCIYTRSNAISHTAHAVDLRKTPSRCKTCFILVYLCFIKPSQAGNVLKHVSMGRTLKNSIEMIVHDATSTISSWNTQKKHEICVMMEDEVICVNVRKNGSKTWVM